MYIDSPLTNNLFCNTRKAKFHMFRETRKPNLVCFTKLKLMKQGGFPRNKHELVFLVSYLYQKWLAAIATAQNLFLWCSPQHRTFDDMQYHMELSSPAVSESLSNFKFSSLAVPESLSNFKFSSPAVPESLLNFKFSSTAVPESLSNFHHPLCQNHFQI